MTVAEVVDRARRYSRINSSAASDGILLEMTKDAVRQFSKDVFGLPMEESLLVSATFDTNTSFAFNIEITGGANALTAADVVITATARTGASGTTVADDLETALNAAIATGDLSITFSNFSFIIDTTTSSASTAIEIGAPNEKTYLDAQDLLGLGGTVEASSGVFTGTFPMDCTRKAALTGTPIAVKHIAWDGCILERAPREVFIKPETSGDPAYYFVEGQKILITPSPQVQKELYVQYKGIPSLSSINSVASGTIPAEIPSDYHIALSYWIASELLLESFEDEMRAQRYSAYYKKVQEYLVNYNNQNTATEPRFVSRLWYRVEE